jgi:hypothetical protein
MSKASPVSNAFRNLMSMIEPPLAANAIRIHDAIIITASKNSSSNRYHHLGMNSLITSTALDIAKLGTTS